MDEKKNFRWVPLAIAISLAGLVTFPLSYSPVTALLLRIKAPQTVFAWNNAIHRPVRSLVESSPEWIRGPMRAYDEWWMPELADPICILPPPMESAPAIPVQYVEYVEQTPTLTNPID